MIAQQLYGVVEGFGGDAIWRPGRRQLGQRGSVPVPEAVPRAAGFAQSGSAARAPRTRPSTTIWHAPSASAAAPTWRARQRHDGAGGRRRSRRRSAGVSAAATRHRAPRRRADRRQRTARPSWTPARPRPLRYPLRRRGALRAGAAVGDHQERAARARFRQQPHARTRRAAHSARAVTLAELVEEPPA